MLKKELIIKEEKTINGVKFNRYQYNKETLWGIKKLYRGYKETLYPYKETLYNNNKYNIINNIDNIYDNNIDRTIEEIFGDDNNV